ncbi:uncharacterized protein AB9X84_002112 isoform 1-T1 [Acanthopagrus schlegelii]
MKTAAFILGLVFIYLEFTEKITSEGQLEGFDDTVVKSACRDRYLWIHVASGQAPRFEAVDENGVHSISHQLASHCGYTISSFKMDGYTTFKASYYSCFTYNQNDEVFTFKFNVMVLDAGGRWISWPVSAVCSGLKWTHREIICEEDYMEVNVNKESSCGGQQGSSGPSWQAAFARAQRMASSVWQLMVLQSDGQVSSMSISEAQRQGYSLTTTAHRVVLRSQYKQPHAELIMVDGVPMEVIRISLFLKQKLMVMMIDVSMACTVSLAPDSGSFNGAQLLWDIPRVVTPLIGEGAGFESRSVSLGVEGLLLDEPTTAARGFSVVQQGHLIQIGVPFGAEGGYRKSLVENNVYKEMYVIFLMYEHVFSLLYEDGSSIDTRHRMLRVLDTPLLCRPPFSFDQTISDDQVFSVYLGNIPADVLLEDVQINGKQLMMSEGVGWGYSISPVVHINGSRAYELRLPFEDTLVYRMYLGQGVVQYSIDVNFTLTIMPQRASYYHHTFVTARVLNTFPPEITAQCSDGGLTFSVVRPPRAESLWEVGINHEPLTSQLADQRGYRLYNDTQRTTLEVPVFSIGYNYEDINLSNFYGTFKLVLRDSKTLEVQTSTSKRCLFKTQDMIVCSADGTMTVVTTPTSTWPTLQPEGTTLLDPTCGPKQTDGARVLFEFKLDSCGTRAMVGESYVVYENEILHDRQLIADGPNFISRDSQFKLTVRCFYPLNGLNRLSVDRIFSSATPGFGSVKVFKSIKAGPANELSAKDCSYQVSRNGDKTLTNQIHETPEAGGILPPTSLGTRPRPGTSHFITVPSRNNKLTYSSQNQQPFPNLNLSPPPEGVPAGTHQSHPSHLMSMTQDHRESGSPTGDHLPSYLPRQDQSPDINFHRSNLNTPSFNVGVRGENPELTKAGPAQGFTTSSRSPGSAVVGVLHVNSESSSQTLTLQGLNSLGDNVGQNNIIKPDQNLPNLQVNLSLGMQELTQPHEASLDFRLYGSSEGRMEMTKPEAIPGYLPQSEYDASQTSLLQPALKPPAQHSRKLLQPGRDQTYVPANTITSHYTVSNLFEDTRGSLSTEPMSTATSQVDQNLERPGSIERRNTETVYSRVKNIRVKPLSKFFSSVQHPNQNTFVQQPNVQISTASTAVSRGGSPWASQQLPALRHSNMRQEHVPEGTGVLTSTSEKSFYTVNGDQTAAIHLSDLSPNQQKPVQSEAKTGNSGAQKPVSTQGNILQAKGQSHYGVRIVPGLPGGFKNEVQINSRGGTGRRSSLNFTPHTITNAAVNIRDHLSNSPTAGAAGFAGSHTDPDGSGGSELDSHTSSDCSGSYGASVHRGIMRGKEIS